MTEINTTGFVGVGNMGRSIVMGMIDNGWSTEGLLVFDLNEKATNELNAQYEIPVADSLSELAEEADLIVLCVKPDVVPTVLESIESKNVQLASIAAGVPLSTLNTHLTSPSGIVRVMPNSPAQVGEGMSFLTPDSRASEELIDRVRQIFDCVGETAVVPESKMDAVTALSGSGPAYLFYFLEALEEAGVYMGLSAEDARKAAEQTVYGSALLARERVDASANELRAEVSSPGGTTVEAIKYFDEKGIKGMIEEAVKRARDKSIELGSK